MASIELQNVHVEFPIFNARGRSLKSALVRKVGGGLETSHDTVHVHALNGVSLSVKPGARLGLVGHNGAGKSTMLRVMCRVYEPTQGVARIQGRVSSLLDLALGMDPELSGEENIVLRGIFLGLSFAEAKERVREIAEFAEIGDYLHLPCRTYSSGMMLRLAFAASTANNPEIVLLDELIGVGDAGFRRKAQERVNQLMQSASILVVSSHDEAVLKQYCDTAILLKGGKILSEGPIDAVLEDYRASREET